MYIKLKNIVSIDLKLFNQVNTNKSCTNCKIKVNVRILKAIEQIEKCFLSDHYNINNLFKCVGSDYQTI